MNQAGLEQKYRRDLAPPQCQRAGAWDRAVDAWMDDDLDELDAV
ncbi:hypothetical protein [Streptomyces badius]